MKPYIEVADETQRIELAKWDKAEKQKDISCLTGFTSIAQHLLGHLPT